MNPLLARYVEIAKANLYGSRVRELRETAARHGLQLNSRSRKREIVEALRANPSFRDARSKTARQLREARALIRDLDQEWGRSPNMLGALRGALSEAEREAPDEGTRRQMRAAEEMVGAHLFGDLDAWKAKEKLNAMRTTRDRRLLPKDHPARAQHDGAGPRKRVRKMAVILKARQTLNAPPTIQAAERRRARYSAFAAAAGKGAGGRSRKQIARLEAEKLGRLIPIWRADVEQERAYLESKTERGGPYSGANAPKKAHGQSLRRSMLESLKPLRRGELTNIHVRAWDSVLPFENPRTALEESRAKARKRTASARRVAKASRSLNAPKNKTQAKRRLGLYERLQESGNGPVARIGMAEAERLRGFLSTGKYGRGMTPGRADDERHRADSEYRRQTRLGLTGAKREQKQPPASDADKPLWLRQWEQEYGSPKAQARNAAREIAAHNKTMERAQRELDSLRAAGRKASARTTAHGIAIDIEQGSSFGRKYVTRSTRVIPWEQA